jgi:hypothetical protein
MFVWTARTLDLMIEEIIEEGAAASIPTHCSRRFPEPCRLYEMAWQGTENEELDGVREAGANP